MPASTFSRRYRDTPFNKDCPHHRMVLLTEAARVDHCPWCGEPSKAMVYREWAASLSLILGLSIWLLGSALVLWFLHK